MNKEKSLISRFLAPVLLVLFVMSMFYTNIYMKFIPNVHNIIIVISILLIILGMLLFIVRLATMQMKKLLKVILVGVFVVLGVYVAFMAYGVGLFSLKSEKLNFEYNGKQYYLLDQSFLDPHHVLHEKDGLLTMKKVHDYVGGFEIDKNNLTEEDKENLVNGSYPTINEYDQMD